MFPGKSPQEHTLAEIVIHTSVALQCVAPGSLAEPLYALMVDPSKMKVFFFIVEYFQLLLTLIEVGSILLFRNGMLYQVISVTV